MGGQFSMGGQPSMGGQLSMGGQPSMGGQLSMGGQPSMGGQLSMGRQPSMGGQFSMGRQLSMGGQPSMGGQFSMGRQLSMANGGPLAAFLRLKKPKPKRKLENIYCFKWLKQSIPRYQVNDADDYDDNLSGDDGHQVDDNIDHII